VDQHTSCRVDRGLVGHRSGVVRAACGGRSGIVRTCFGGSFGHRSGIVERRWMTLNDANVVRTVLVPYQKGSHQRTPNCGQNYSFTYQQNIPHAASNCRGISLRSRLDTCVAINCGSWFRLASRFASSFAFLFTMRFMIRAF